MAFDLRWKVALNLDLDFDRAPPSSLRVFRGRRQEDGLKRYGFDRLMAMARAAGFLPKKVSPLIDTTPQLGAGAAHAARTYTLICKGIRRVLKAAGYHVQVERRGLAISLAPYPESDHKADIDRHDPAAWAAQLKVRLADAHAALELALMACDDAEVRSAGG